MHSVEHSSWASSMSQAQGPKSRREYTLRMERKRYVSRKWQNNSFTYAVGEAGVLFNRTWVKVVSSTWASVPGKMPSCHVDKAVLLSFHKPPQGQSVLGLSTPQGTLRDNATCLPQLLNNSPCQDWFMMQGTQTITLAWACHCENFWTAVPHLPALTLALTSPLWSMPSSSDFEVLLYLLVSSFGVSLRQHAQNKLFSNMFPALLRLISTALHSWRIIYVWRWTAEVWTYFLL